MPTPPASPGPKWFNHYPAKWFNHLGENDPGPCEQPFTKRTLSAVSAVQGFRDFEGQGLELLVARTDVRQIAAGLEELAEAFAALACALDHDPVDEVLIALERGLGRIEERLGLVA